MKNVLEKKMFNYFARLNGQKKKPVAQMLNFFSSGRLEKAKHTIIGRYNIELDEANEAKSIFMMIAKMPKLIKPDTFS